MALPNIFDKKVSDEVIGRINKLTPETQPKWGKMTVGQMLAHCCVTYEMIFDNKHKAPGGFARMLLKLFVKDVVVSEKPYKRNSRTAPAFLMTTEKEFNTEKKRLVDYIKKTEEMGSDYFVHKESLSFGKLTKEEWNNMFYKHLDHHLSQFGV
jgi:hypothetical protein